MAVLSRRIMVSWYQLKHGLQVWAIRKGAFNVSSLSTREGSDGSSNAQEVMVVLRFATWEKSEFVTRGPSKLAKQQNYRKTVAHFINPGEVTWFVHATDLVWQCSWCILCELKMALKFATEVSTQAGLTFNYMVYIAFILLRCVMLCASWIYSVGRVICPV